MSKDAAMRAWLCIVASAACGAQAEPPKEWVERETGHRVVRLSREGGTASLYFHQNPFTAKGDKFVVTTPSGLATIDLKTRAIEPLSDGRGSHIVVGKNTRQVFYVREGAVHATHLDTKATREIARFSPELRRGSGFGVNADETLLVGSMVVGERRAPRREPSDPFRRGSRLEERWAMHFPMALYTVDIGNGNIKRIYHTNEWLNHVQCSPSDAGLVMFCHEGPWHKVDRIWTIRTDGTGLQKIHSRKMDMEIAGHEFFGPDGKVLWYDLQTPKGKEFWLEGHVLASGEKIRYAVRREHWSVHYNVSWDGKQFAGDGGGPRSVAAPGNGQWIYLLTPREGKLEARKLVDLSKHDYELEPNVMFTPDGKWIIFRSNMHGATHVYAVEVRPTQPTNEARGSR
jgi:oligogalacturonide lyase